jgi:hypothetical protein
MPNMTRCASLRLPALVLAPLLLAFCLAGCWVPEHYIARIKIDRDGAYSLYMEGTALYPDSWRALHAQAPAPKEGKPDGEAEQKRRNEALAPLLKELTALKSDPRVMAANSLGDGRVRFSFMGNWKLKTNRVISREQLEPLAYSVGPDKTVRVEVKDALPDWEGRALHVAVDGDLSIVLAEGIEVLETNAQRKPGSPRGAYRWHIDGTTTQVPYMKLRLPGAEPAPQPQSSQVQKKLAHH